VAAGGRRRAAEVRVRSAIHLRSTPKPVTPGVLALSHPPGGSPITGPQRPGRAVEPLIDLPKKIHHMPKITNFIIFGW
jgi:hypothetical protein